MTTCKEIFQFINSFAPIETQEHFDNAGFLFGEIETNVSKVLLSLDVTSEVIEEAYEKNAQLIISHHPLIFGGLYHVFPKDPTGKKLIALAKHNICVLSMHTNLDKAVGGVNDALIRRLADDVCTDGSCPDPYLRIGLLKKEQEMMDYLTCVKESLHTNGIRYHNSGRCVYKIACSGGAGGDGLQAAAQLGCDTFISSDIKYSVFLDAKELEINLIDADHFCTENPVMFELERVLSAAFPSVDFKISERHHQTACFF